MQQREWRQGWTLSMPQLDRLGWLVHAFTAGQLNLSPDLGPDTGRACDLRGDLCRRLELDFDRLTAVEQVHGAEVVNITAADEGAGRFGRSNAIPMADGLLCDRSGVGLLLLSADCPLLVVADPARRAVGAAHCGWRSIMAGICTRLVAQMQERFGSVPADMSAAIGPCPCPEHYPVGPEMQRIAAGRFDTTQGLLTRRGDRWLFDLRAAILDRLGVAGVPVERIALAGECTVGDDRFFSYRRQGPDAGRFALVVAVR